MSFAERFVRLRGTRGFLAGIIGFIAFWVGLHFATGFDRDWGALNLILSSEASIALAFFTMASSKVDEAQRKTDERMLHLLEAVHALLEERGR